MVLKLIESGGFIGKSRSAELDIHTLSIDEQKVIKDFILKQADMPTVHSGKSRDQFQYFIEYEGKSIALPEISSANKMLTEVFEKLIDNLHY